MNAPDFLDTHPALESNISTEDDVYDAVVGLNLAFQDLQSALKNLAYQLKADGKIETFQALNEIRWEAKQMGGVIRDLYRFEQKKLQDRTDFFDAVPTAPNAVTVGDGANIEIYTDGACLGNPGPGGWAALLRSPDGERELVGSELDTTNNRMEMMGAIAALEALPDMSVVTLHSDSQYLIKGITEWFHGWVQNGWRTSAGKPVKNADLWERLHTARLRHNVRWQWVKGHAGNPGNERVDALANAAAERVLMGSIDHPPNIHNALEKVS